MFQKFLAPAPQNPALLEATPRFPQAHHLWQESEMRALAVAGFSGRPLLVTGEPGVGKSQLARAAAKLLGWRFEHETITPRFEPQDLLWRYDAVRRLSDAGQSKLHEDESKYVTPGVLWRAIDPASAQSGLPANSEPNCVLLLDEIDKADSDLPNSLLEVLANRSFKTPWGSVPAVATNAAGAGTPAAGLLIVITSNEERELPLAFMRRCVVLDMKVPAEQPAFEAWLVQRGQAQFASMHSSIRERAARMVWADRQASPLGQGARPGLAEYLDLLRALQEIAGATHPASTADEVRALQDHWLTQLSPYVLRKQGQDQSPPATASQSLDG